MPVDRTEVLAELDYLIRDTLGEFSEDVTITMDSDLRDLGLESLDVVELAGRIQAYYGPAVNVAEFAGGLAADQVAELRVGRLVDFIARVAVATPEPAR